MSTAFLCLLATKHGPECLTFIALILVVERAKWLCIHFHFADEKIEAQISLSAHARHSACLHQTVECFLFLISKFGFTLKSKIEKVK